MFANYGDVNFFEWGNLVETLKEGTEYEVLVCRPYSDEDNVYQFSRVNVDLNDTWLDLDAVKSFIGMTDDDYDPVILAIGCIDYYGVENFGVDYSLPNWNRMTKEEIQNILSFYDIDPRVKLD